MFITVEILFLFFVLFFLIIIITIILLTSNKWSPLPPGPITSKEKYAEKSVCYGVSFSISVMTFSDIIL